jgi:adenylate kinase family enzyme
MPSKITKPRSEVQKPKAEVVESPADLAADLLVRRTLSQHPEIAPAILKECAAVVVRVPSLPWMDAIADAWLRVLCPTVTNARECEEARPWLELRSNCLGYSVACDLDRDSKVASARSDGRPIVGFSDDPEKLLPLGLTLIADHWVTVEMFDPDALAAFAEKLTGTPATIPVNGLVCNILTLGDLQLAKRPGQSADEYLRELSRITIARHGMGEAAEANGADTPGTGSVDAATTAATVALSRALETAPGLVDAFRSGRCAVTVEVPSDAWVATVAAAWQAIVGAPGSTSYDGDRLQRLKPWLTKPKSYVVFQRPSTGGQKPTSGNGILAVAISDGVSVVGISPAPQRYLPSDLCRIADFSLSVGPLDCSGFEEMVRLLTGAKPAAPIGQDVCRALSPDDLRLAYRRGQSADDFVAAAIRLVPAAASPRSLGLDDMHGMKEAVDWGKGLAEDLRLYRTGLLQWNDIDRGIVLCGPPGTGKTTFGRALATTCGVPLISASLADWQARGHLGDLLKAMKASFDEARKSAPCILLVDEIDSFGDRRNFADHNKDYSTQVVNGFLEELDGAIARDGVVVVGACNCADQIDPAITRSGRLERFIYIGLPDFVALAKIFRLYLGRDLRDADLSSTACLALGASGADCQRWIRGARRRARTAGRPMTIDDLLAEIRGPGDDRTHDERRLAAIHESGHALAQCLRRPGTLISVTLNGPRESRSYTLNWRPGCYRQREDILAELQVLLAGRAAEELVLGAPSGGAGGDRTSDLARATLLAVDMVSAQGLDEKLGVLWTGRPSANDLVNLFVARPRMAARVSDYLATAYKQVVALLKEHEELLVTISNELMTKGILTGDEVMAIVAKASAGRPPADAQPDPGNPNQDQPGSAPN